ncbi:MAG: CAAD domain-containing protein [Cyanobium sp.]
MSETPGTTPETGSTTAVVESPSASESAEQGADHGFDLSGRVEEVVGKINATLGQVDWAQMSKFIKAGGILLAVIVAQVLIKGVLDTINLLPIIPGLLELLGLVIVGKWSWENLTTSEKRTAVIERLQGLRREYLG